MICGTAPVQLDAGVKVYAPVASSVKLPTVPLASVTVMADPRECGPVIPAIENALTVSTSSSSAGSSVLRVDADALEPVCLELANTGQTRSTESNYAYITLFIFCQCRKRSPL